MENLRPELAFGEHVRLSLDLGRRTGRDQLTALHPFGRYFVVEYLALCPSLELRGERRGGPSALVPILLTTEETRVGKFPAPQ